MIILMFFIMPACFNFAFLLPPCNQILFKSKALRHTDVLNVKSQKSLFLPDCMSVFLFLFICVLLDLWLCLLLNTCLCILLNMLLPFSWSFCLAFSLTRKIHLLWILVFLHTSKNTNFVCCSGKVSLVHLHALIIFYADSTV